MAPGRRHTQGRFGLTNAWKHQGQQLSHSPHQLYHADKSFFIHPDMCLGNWPELIRKYSKGLTQDLAFNLLYYIKRALDNGCTNDNGLLDLREQIKDWSNIA